MTRTDDPEHDRDESPARDTRYAGFATEDGFVLYDTENEAAWIESDTTLILSEMA